MDGVLSRFDYGHASVRLHCISWFVGIAVHILWTILLPLDVQTGQTALFIACKEGHDQIVEFLLRREADVNHQTKVRPLMIM